MKNNQLFTFFTVVFTIYSLANIYVYFKGYYAIPFLRNHNIIYAICFFLVGIIFITAKILESRHSSVITDVLNIIGGFWLAFLLYGFFLFLISDIILLFLKITGTIEQGNIGLFRKISLFSTLIISAFLIIGGLINALIPKITEYNIEINKPAGNVKSLRIAAVSDIHLGSVIRKRSIRKLSSMLQDQKPDIVLLLGDILDGEIGPVLRGDLLQYFTIPQCNDGLYAITGNHEFIGGGNRTIPYIESKGIRVLKDEVVTLEGGIQLAGRIDRDARRFYGRDRMTLPELLKDADTTKPIILLDHQPYNLDQSVKSGVDLQLSGHTHNGQMWPITYITKAIYELSYGYLKKGNTNFIVSSGYGLWGPRVRLGSRSEILLINIKFRE
jgi:uncharacterized protein